MAVIQLLLQNMPLFFSDWKTNIIMYILAKKLIGLDFHMTYD